MKKIFVAVLFLSVIISWNSNAEKKESEVIPQKTETDMTINNLSPEQKADGWELLFDGTTTNGWHKFNGDKVGSAWKIQDSAIYLDSGKKTDGRIPDGGDIATDAEFENFHLKLEWKIAKDGNSGIMFNVHEDPAKYTWPWETGPEMQVLDNNGHPDARIIKHRAGDLYDLISCSKETVKPFGEWNLAEIKCVNGKLDFYLNGENVVSTMLWDDAWKKMVAASKFSKMPDFATYKKGLIALQDHGDNVWYRNVMIKKL